MITSKLLYSDGKCLGSFNSKRIKVKILSCSKIKIHSQNKWKDFYRKGTLFIGSFSSEPGVANEILENESKGA